MTSLTLDTVASESKAGGPAGVDYSIPWEVMHGGGEFTVQFGDGSLGMTLEVTDGGEAVAVETTQPTGAAHALGVRPGDVIMDVGGGGSGSSGGGGSSSRGGYRSVADAIDKIKASPRPLAITFDRKIRSVLMFYDFIPQAVDDHRVESMADLLVRVNKTTLKQNWDVLNLETVRQGRRGKAKSSARRARARVCREKRKEKKSGARTGGGEEGQRRRV